MQTVLAGISFDDIQKQIDDSVEISKLMVVKAAQAVEMGTKTQWDVQ